MLPICHHHHLPGRGWVVVTSQLLCYTLPLYCCCFFSIFLPIWQKYRKWIGWLNRWMMGSTPWQWARSEFCLSVCFTAKPPHHHLRTVMNGKYSKYISIHINNKLRRRADWKLSEWSKAKVKYHLSPLYSPAPETQRHFSPPLNVRDIYALKVGTLFSAATNGMPLERTPPLYISVATTDLDTQSTIQLSMLYITRGGK